MSVASRPRVCGFPLSRYPWYVRLILMLQRRKYGRALERHCPPATLDVPSQYESLTFQ